MLSLWFINILLLIKVLLQILRLMICQLLLFYSVTGKFDLPISNDNEVLYDSRSHHDVEYFITNIVDMRVCPA